MSCNTVDICVTDDGSRCVQDQAIDGGLRSDSLQSHGEITMNTIANRWKRYADWDNRPLRLDRFAAEDPANGFSAFAGLAGPQPGLSIADGRVISLDGVLERDFDLIDRFIARHHIDVSVAPQAMAMSISPAEMAWDAL